MKKTMIRIATALAACAMTVCATMSTVASAQASTTLLGDLNGDNRVLLNDVLDAVDIYTYMALDIAKPTEEQLMIVDIDGNQAYEMFDLICILNYYKYHETLGLDISYEDIINGKV